MSTLIKNLKSKIKIQESLSSSETRSAAANYGARGCRRKSAQPSSVIVDPEIV